MYKSILILLFPFLSQCSIDRTIHPISKTEKQTLTEFQNVEAESKLFITEDIEPGEKLILCLTFVDKTDKKQLIGQKVHFYHASISGDYQPAYLNDETTARLNGAAVTDSIGRIYIETILPGDYGSSKDNRHIHTTVAGAKPEAYDIHFKQYTTYMGKRNANESDQFFLAELKNTDAGKLVTFLTFEVKNPTHIK